MKIYTGTSGYSYKEWKGSFYPDDIKPDEMLSYYSQQLSAVEINNTFYRMPKSHVVESWRDAVGKDFRFSFKASRRITHIKRLKDIEEPLGYLISRAAILEDRLGAVLFQLPPNFKQNTERLTALLEAWPTELPCAFEFRNDTWFEPETYELLAKHSAAIVVSEDGEMTLPDQVCTAPNMYLRLRKPGYTLPALRKWLAACKQSDSEQVFAFFKHEDEGAGPKLAKRFAELAERPEPRRAPRRSTAITGTARSAKR